MEEKHKQDIKDLLLQGPRVLQSNNVLGIVCKGLMSDLQQSPKSWHSASESRRVVMTQCIANLIQQRHRNCSVEWIEKLAEVAKRVEKRLYHMADSYEEYNDPQTLIDRLYFLIKFLVEDANTKSVQLPEEHDTEKEFTGGNDEEADDGSTESTDDDVKDYASTSLSKLPKQKRSKPKVSNRQVSAQGCSRVFIIKVLRRISDFVKGKYLPSIFTFRTELIKRWLIEAKEDCMNPSYESEELYYGGPPFQHDDATTHWSEAHQLHTWWKNNVERRSKFQILQRDSSYLGIDHRRIARARWCEMIVALSEVIRSSSGQSGSSHCSSSGSSIPIRCTQEEGCNDMDPTVPTPQQYSKRIGKPIDRPHRKHRLEKSYDKYEPDDCKYEFEKEVEEEEEIGQLNNSLFISTLYDLVSSADEASLVWLENRSGFTIVDIDSFVDTVLQNHFQIPDFTTFKRYLLLSGFREVLDGPEQRPGSCAYCHDLFVLGNKSLAEQICCQKLDSEGYRLRLPRGLGRVSDEIDGSNAASGDGVVRKSARCSKRPRVGEYKEPPYRVSSRSGLDGSGIDETAQMSCSKPLLKSHRLIEVDCSSDSGPDPGAVSGHLAFDGVKDPDMLPESMKYPTSQDNYHDIFTVDLSFKRPRRITMDFTKICRTLPLSDDHNSRRDVASCVDDSDRNGDVLLPKCSRVGDRYQANVPRWSGPPSIDDCVEDSATRFWAPTDSTSASNDFEVVQASPLWSTHQVRVPGDIAIVSLHEFGNDSDSTADDESNQRRKIATLSCYRLCCIVSIHTKPVQRESCSIASTDLLATVFDGDQEHDVALSSVSIYSWKPRDIFVSKDLCEDVPQHSMSWSRWTLSEVNAFCVGIRRYSDDLHKIFPSLAQTRSFVEVVDFYSRLYSHVRCGGYRRLLRIFRKAAGCGKRDEVPEAELSDYCSGGDDDNDALVIKPSYQEGGPRGDNDKRSGSKRRRQKLPCATISKSSKEPRSSKYSGEEIEELVLREVGGCEDLSRELTCDRTSDNDIKLYNDISPRPRPSEALGSSTTKALASNRFTRHNSCVHPVVQSAAVVHEAPLVAESSPAQPSQCALPKPIALRSAPITQKASNGITNQRVTRSRSTEVVGPSRNRTGSTVSLALHQQEAKVFCVCRTEENGRYLACSNPSGSCPCNGWVHASCVGKETLSDAALRAIDNYVCPPCKLRLKVRNKRC